MPVWVDIQSLSCPVNLILVRLSVRKLLTKLTVHSGNPFRCRIWRSLLGEMLSKAPARSRLSIETTHLHCAFHAVSTQEESRSTAGNVDRFFLAPIWFQGVGCD